MRVAVIGAGLQGAGVALELSLRGVTVDLFEKRPDCMLGASLHNEGKIHLGFVYAKDPTLRTARLMVRGALAFQPILRRWLDSDLADCPVSSPFFYIVHRDSLLDAADLARYYDAVSSLIADAGPEARYFQQNLGSPVTRLTGQRADAVADPEWARAVFETPEIAVDPAWLARRVAARVHADPHICLYTLAHVTRITPDPSAVALTWQQDGQRHTRTYDHVVNASWEDLLALDATAGLEPPASWSFRTKYFLNVRTRRAVPSATVVLGPFGDVVACGAGTVYLSWYPEGRLGVSHGLHPPPPESFDGERATQLRTGTFDGLRRLMPALDALREDAASASIGGGVIYALGDTDVDDPVSRLHERHSVGPHSTGRYHSVNTGKYTLAPLFAVETADRIAGGTL